MAIADSKPLYLRLEPELKHRLEVQCNRLAMSQSAVTRMALVKFLEEEELIQYQKGKRD